MPPPFAIRVKTASGWQDIAIQGATGPQGLKGDSGSLPIYTVGATAPTNPAVGDYWQEGPASGGYKIWNGSTWQGPFALPGPVGNDLYWQSDPDYSEGPLVSVANNQTAILPVPSANITQTSSLDGVNPDFTRNSNGTITIRAAGTYTVNAQVGGTPGTVGKPIDGRICAGPTTPNQYKYFAWQDSQSYDTGPVFIDVTGVIYCPVGYIIAVYGGHTAGAAMNMNVSRFAISRNGSGPQGLKGDQGIQGIPGGTIGTASMFGDGAPYATSLAAAAWKTIPVLRALNIEPANAFTINADGSVSVTNAGYYTVSASAYLQGASTGALYLSLGSLPNAEGTYAETDMAATGLVGNVAVAALYMAAGQKVFVCAYSGAATGPVQLRQFSIGRVGGSQGQMEIYTQPDEPPGTAKPGAIWVDTDQGVPLITTSQVAQAYVMTAGYTKDRTMNPTSMSLNEVAAVLATLIDDLRAAGIVKP